VGAGVPPALCGRDGRTHNCRTHNCRTHITSTHNCRTHIIASPRTVSLSR